MKNDNIKSKKDKFVKVCPRCGSIDVSVDFSNPVVWSAGTTVNYMCNGCKHIAQLFPEISLNKIDAFKDELKREIEQGKVTQGKEKIVDATTGVSVIVTEIMGYIGISALVLAGAAIFFFRKNFLLLIAFILVAILIIGIFIRAYKKDQFKVK